MTQFPNSLGVTKTMRSISQPMGTYRKAPMLVLWSVIACLSAMSTDAWVTQANAQATDPSGQNSGGQSFSFGFGGASAGFSFGGGKPNELRSPGETDSSSTPSSRSNSFRSGMSKTMTNVNGNIVEKSVEDRDGVMTSTVRIKNKKQDVLIEESDEIGIRVTITETVRGKEKKTEHQADSRKELKKKSPAAFEWVKKYASEAGNQPMGNNANAQGFAFGNGNGTAVGQEEAQKMMREQIEQMIQQTEDPLVKQQLRSMLEQVQKSFQNKNDPQ